jgi:hypothetical protein
MVVTENKLEFKISQFSQSDRKKSKTGIGLFLFLLCCPLDSRSPELSYCGIIRRGILVLITTSSTYPCRFFS